MAKDDEERMQMFAVRVPASQLDEVESLVELAATTTPLGKLRKSDIQRAIVERGLAALREELNRLSPPSNDEKD